MNDEENEQIEDMEETSTKNEIEELIDNEELESNGGELACPNCETLCEIYCHKYDDELCAITCPNCRYDEWITTGSSSSPYRCERCEDFVTDEQVENGTGIVCVAVDIEGNKNCEQRSHVDCAEFCEDCGYLCEDEVGDYLECNSCGKLHEQSHFVSFGSDFVDEFGLICEFCFHEDEDEYHVDLPYHKIGTASEEEELAEEEAVEKFIETKREEAKAKKITEISKEEPVDAPILHMAHSPGRKRSDQSTYLSHFVKKRDGMNDEECFNQLVKIITDKKLEARPTGYFSTYKNNPAQTAISKAVCLTEGRLSALKDHAEQYSYFGLAIGKYKLMRDFQCAPCIYINHLTIKNVRDSLPNELIPFVNMISCSGGIDYHHEREWRTPGDVTFEHGEINFIFAPKKFHEKILEILEQRRPMFCIDTIINL